MVLRPKVQSPTELKSPLKGEFKPLVKALQHARKSSVLPATKPTLILLKSFSQYWGIENSVHWVLDIGFREDESRIRTGRVPENMAVLRHIALNVLRNDDTRLGIKNKRLKAGWDTDYLTHLLCGELERLLYN